MPGLDHFYEDLIDKGKVFSPEVDKLDMVSGMKEHLAPPLMEQYGSSCLPLRSPQAYL